MWEKEKLLIAKELLTMKEKALENMGKGEILFSVMFSNSALSRAHAVV